MSTLQNLTNLIPAALGRSSGAPVISPSLGEARSANRAVAIELDKNISSHRKAAEDYLSRAKRAKDAGLDPEKFAMPFPGNTTTVNQSGGLSSLIPLLAGAGLLAAGTWAAGNLSKVPAASSPSPVVQPEQDIGVKADLIVVPPGGQP